MYTIREIMFKLNWKIKLYIEKSLLQKGICLTSNKENGIFIKQNVKKNNIICASINEIDLCHHRL